MNIDIRDAEGVSAIRPVDAALYLRASGWRQRAPREHGPLRPNVESPPVEEESLRLMFDVEDV